VTEVDEQLARRLVDSQFPQWAGLPIRPVELGGWDNRTFRLGEELSVRLPSSASYRLQVEKEQRWLPLLAPELPLPIPEPVAQGAPGDGYPFAWSVYRWIAGTPAAPGAIADEVAFARSLAAFLVALGRADARGGPEPGEHNFLRGAHVSVYGEETERAVAALGAEIPRDDVLRVWEAAVATRWERAPVWFHGDVAVGNLLLRAGRLAAVIDFGSSGVGDPACDTVIAWTLLAGPSRDAFRAAYGGDPALWARGRGWALWKALITLVGYLEDGDDRMAVDQHRIIRAVIGDQV
jgi:aminoglycoside phosphotransferase (APT) family kinase protein